jgi:septal ring factor EnvC (AmiA/AmiB activator)
MNMSQASNGISGEINALKDLIVVLSHQVAQIAEELTATKNELTATKNELIANKSEMEALKTELAAMIQTQLSNIQVPASASPSYAAVARTPPNSQPSNLPSFSSRSLTPSTMTDTLYCTIDTSRMNEEDKSKAQPGVIREGIEKEMRRQTERNN